MAGRSIGNVDGSVVDDEVETVECAAVGKGLLRLRGSYGGATRVGCGMSPKAARCRPLPAWFDEGCSCMRFVLIICLFGQSLVPSP
jgi:hypothetical protein